MRTNCTQSRFQSQWFQLIFVPFWESLMLPYVQTLSLIQHSQSLTNKKVLVGGIPDSASEANLQFDRPASITSNASNWTITSFMRHRRAKARKLEKRKPPDESSSPPPINATRTSPPVIPSPAPNMAPSAPPTSSDGGEGARVSPPSPLPPPQDKPVCILFNFLIGISDENRPATQPMRT